MVRLSRLYNQNKATVVQAMNNLVCPAPGHFVDMKHHDKTLEKKYCHFTVNWDEPYSGQPPVPLGFLAARPDYGVGVSYDAFSHDQRVELDVISIRWSS